MFSLPKRLIMWQRIQTLFFLLAIASNLIPFFLDLAYFPTNEGDLSFGMYGLEDSELHNSSTSYWLAILCTISMIISLLALLQFKRRAMQIKLSQFNLLIQIGFIMALFFAVEQSLNELSVVQEVGVADFKLGSYFTLLPLVFLFLAIRSIKKDEALVRAADRIR